MKHILIALMLFFVSYSIVWMIINLMIGCSDWSEPNCIGYFQILSGDV